MAIRYSSAPAVEICNARALSILALSAIPLGGSAAADVFYRGMPRWSTGRPWRVTDSGLHRATAHVNNGPGLVPGLGYVTIDNTKRPLLDGRADRCATKRRQNQAISICRGRCARECNTD